MDTQTKNKAGPLIRSVIVLQLKLLLGAARDFALIPIALVAALIDLVQLKKAAPQYFRKVLQFGERTDEWIDVWYTNHDNRSEPRENVDALLARVEQVVRDPQTGARRARVLKRWAERQAARARQHVTRQLSERKADKQE